MNGDKPTHGLVISSSEIKRLEAIADKQIKADNGDEDPGVFVSLWPAQEDGKTKLENKKGVRVFEKNGGES